MAGVYKEIWTGKMVEQFDAAIEASFLNLIPSYDRYVQSSGNGENQVIHLVDMGVDPDVLVNNNTYPIEMQKIVDGDIVQKLDKFQTKRTPIADDDLYAISYNKIESLIKRHKNAILKRRFRMAIHALAPTSNTKDTPIIVSTGSAVAGKKRVTLNDVINLRQAFNEAGVPDDGERVLVLSSDHVTDLLIEEKDLYKDYVNNQKGRLQPLLYGFKVFTYNDMPYFSMSKKTKVAFDAEPTNQDAKASVAFYAPDMFRAKGATKMYYDKPDTAYQSTRINFRHYYLVAPMKQRAIGAIINAGA